MPKIELELPSFNSRTLNDSIKIIINFHLYIYIYIYTYISYFINIIYIGYLLPNLLIPYCSQTT